ncbi:MAG: PAS domain-containing protein, partial [Spirochaetota bacterium]
MSHEILSIAEAAISTLIVLSAYTYVYLKHRSRSMMLWAVGWSWYLVRLFLTLFEASALIEIASLLSGWFLLAGSYVFVGRRVRPVVTGMFVLAGVWRLVAGALGGPLWTTALPTLILLGAAKIRMGTLIGSTAGSRSFGERVASIGLVLWGLHTLNYPFLRDVAWFAPIGFTIDGLLALVVGVGMLMVFLDRTHEQMRLSEDRFRSLVGSMEDIVITTDPRGRVADAYGGWFERNRIGREDLLDRELAEVLDHRHDEIVYFEIGRAMDGAIGHRTLDIDLFGTERWFSFTISPLRDRLDRAIGTVVVGRDITDCAQSRNALAERLRENETLLQEVHHRVKNNMQI